MRRALTLAVRDPQMAEDMAQEGFARALRRWHVVSVADRPAAWVYVVAVREARRRQRKAALEDGPRWDEGAHVDVLADVDLHAALDTLAPRQRMAVVLRLLADLSVADTARAMRCSEGTVKATLHKALARLRVELEEVEEVRDAS